MTDPSSAAVFGAVLATLWTAHLVGDHWVQTNGQATAKGRPGWSAAAHVATYTMTLVLALAVADWRLGLCLDPLRTAAGLAVTAVTHYVADRITPLIALADALGKGAFVRLGDPAAAPTGNGRYSLDSAFHAGFLLVSALIIA